MGACTFTGGEVGVSGDGSDGVGGGEGCVAVRGCVAGSAGLGGVGEESAGLGGCAAGTPVVFACFARSCRRYSSTAAIPTARVTRSMTRGQKREPDGAALRARGIGVRRASARPPLTTAAGSPATTSSSATSIADASSNRSAGFFAIACSTTA